MYLKMQNFLQYVSHYIRKSYIYIFFIKCLNSWRYTAKHPLRFIYKSKMLVNEGDASIWVDENYYKSDFYLKIDKRAKIFIEYVTRITSKNDSILDICCNQGRFLYHLKSHGYSHLYGFDIMGPAIERLKNNSNYDEKIIHAECCMAQDYLRRQKSNSFDWAITYTATIELIHPEFDIFYNLSRILRKGMILAINENGHTYPRFYRYLIKKNGFDLIYSKKISNDVTLLCCVKNKSKHTYNNLI